jgi:hypothetical protein
LQVKDLKKNPEITQIKSIKTDPPHKTSKVVEEKPNPENRLKKEIETPKI